MEICFVLDPDSYFSSMNLRKERWQLDGNGMVLVGKTKPRTYSTHKRDKREMLLLEFHVTERHSSNGEMRAVRSGLRVHLIVEERDMDSTHFLFLQHIQSFHGVQIDGREEKVIVFERLFLLVQEERRDC